jgi:ectoine hydroxylase-related dioxygenase (phytanoyl-CoA dioxygenase family)
LTPEDGRLFEQWIQNGFVVLEGAVAPERIDRYRAELDEAWRTGDAHTQIEIYEGGMRRFVPLAERYRSQPHKVLDHHARSRLAREIQFAPRTVRFLSQLFERPPLAFQSLGFQWGTEQPMHQDTAYVVLRSPMEMVGSWVALEDVQVGSGELQYYVGSHRIPEFVWFGRARAKPHELEDDRDFLRWVCAQSEALGCPLVPFRPRKGDVLLWHADLVHGGARRERADLTRQSLVTHYCPVNVDPEWMGRLPSEGKREHAPGCFYCSPAR